VNGGEFAFKRSLLRLGPKKAARRVLRDVVGLTVRALAQISRITNAVTYVDAAIIKSNIADLLDPLPAFGPIHLHWFFSRCGFVLRYEGAKDRHNPLLRRARQLGDLLLPLFQF
jgi:hypothetical protein